jgi:hypothetical protein
MQRSRSSNAIFVWPPDLRSPRCLLAQRSSLGMPKKKAAVAAVPLAELLAKPLHEIPLLGNERHPVNFGEARYGGASVDVSTVVAEGVKHTSGRCEMRPTLARPSLTRVLHTRRNKLEGILFNASPGRFGEFDAYTHLWACATSSKRSVPCSLERGMLVGTKGLHGEFPWRETLYEYSLTPGQFRCFDQRGDDMPVKSSDLRCGTLMRILRGKKAVGTKHEQSVVFGLVWDEMDASGSGGWAYRTLPQIQPFMDDSGGGWATGPGPSPPVVMNPEVGFTLGWNVDEPSGLYEDEYAGKYDHEWNLWDSALFAVDCVGRQLEEKLRCSFVPLNVSSAVRHAQHLKPPAPLLIPQMAPRSVRQPRIEVGFGVAFLNRSNHAIFDTRVAEETCTQRRQRRWRRRRRGRG